MYNGLIHVYYGYGKGKTTAALGLGLRACGSGKKVVLLQFLKDAKTSELAALAALPGFTVLRGKAGPMFARDMSPEELAQTKAIHDANLCAALSLAEEGKCDLLILDEALDAYSLGLLNDVLFRRVVIEKPAALELVLTGHAPVDWVLEAADYATEMVKRKHPYDRGIMGRKGIEF